MPVTKAGAKGISPDSTLFPPMEQTYTTTPPALGQVTQTQGSEHRHRGAGAASPAPCPGDCRRTFPVEGAI